MKKKIVSFFYTLLVLVFLGLIGFLLVKFIVVLSGKINKDNANFFGAMVVGSVTIIGYFITRYLERKKLIEQQIREQKLPTYEEFLDFIFKLFKDAKLNKKMSDEELQKLYWELNKKAILWLSDRSLKSYSTWRSEVIKFSKRKDSTKEENARVLIAFENLLLDFRKDIGHDNKKLTTGDILSLFINDWENTSNHK